MIRRIPRMRPLYVEPDGTLWAGRGTQLHRSDDAGGSFSPVATYRGDMTQRLGQWSRLAARLFRSGFHTVLPLPDGSCIATVRGRLVKQDPHATTFREVFLVPRGSRPLNLCTTPDGSIFFGEYFFNRERQAVHIYASVDRGESWEVAHTFAPGAIRHVHGVFYDRFRRGCWVLTGDEDHESKILLTEDGFRSLEVVFEGSQRYRAVSAIPRPDCLITGTDTPHRPNYVQRLYPESGRSERVVSLPGSVLQGAEVGPYQVFSVSAEPSRVNTSRDASLYVSKGGTTWSRLYARRRDRWQPRYGPWPDVVAERAFLQHPAFLLPHGHTNRPILYAYGQALSKDDDCLLVWDLERLETGGENGPSPGPPPPVARAAA